MKVRRSLIKSTWSIWVLIALFEIPSSYWYGEGPTVGERNDEKKAYRIWFRTCIAEKSICRMVLLHMAFQVYCDHSTKWALLKDFKYQILVFKVMQVQCFTQILSYHIWNIIWRMKSQWAPNLFFDSYFEIKPVFQLLPPPQFQS